MTVDDINRPVSKAYLDAVEPTPDVAYAYDQAQYGIGLPYQTTNGEVTTTVIAYDEMGRQAELQKSITGADPRTMSWTYDYAGRVKRLTYPHTDTSPIFFVDYAFHSGTGLLHTTTGSDSTVYATMTGYQPNGKIGNMVFGNGATTNYGYDGWSERLTGIYTVAGGNDVQDRAYQYTAAGDIEGIDDSYNMESYYYSYDKLHRLRSETTSTGSVGVIPAIMDLAYDDPGHIHAVSQVTTRGQVYDYDYDLNGNQTAGPDLTDPLSVVERSLVFNADNMPVLVTHPNSGITSFVYDGNAKRAKKVGNGKTTYYYADEFELIDNVETHYVFAGNLRVAQVKNDQTTYFHKDHLGSSTAVTDVSGNVSASTMYMPFGGRRGEGAGIGTTDYLFTDQERDASTGLYNYDARLYDPAVGQFVSPDSIIPNIYNPQSLNRFAYCLNNPLKYKDPIGHFVVSSSIAIGYGSYALGTALAVGIAHYAAPIAADIGKWLKEKLSDDTYLSDSTNTGRRRKNRIPDIGEPGTIKSNKPGTTKKKYGEDGWGEKEFQKGHGPEAPENEQEDHIHDHEPNPYHPKGRPDRQEGREPTDEELDEFGQVDSGMTDNNGGESAENGNGESGNDETNSF